VDRVVGLDGVQVEYAMVEAPDGHGRLELVKFHSPSGRPGDGHAPANILGIRHVAFAVDDIDAAVATVRARSGELVGEVENGALSGVCREERQTRSCCRVSGGTRNRRGWGGGWPSMRW
jgi:Glyoxalase/Bleomycin resistance protein/Dioxygenase superfamily